MPFNVVLDLDETLVHTIIGDDIDPKWSHFIHHHTTLLNQPATVFERPFLREFLQGLEGLNIAVWTCGHQIYGEFIAKHIIQPYLLSNQKLDFVWGREHCIMGQQIYGSKIYKHVDYVYEHYKKYKPNDTIIIDDNVRLKTKRNRVYTIPPFTGLARDSALMDALSYITNLAILSP